MRPWVAAAVTGIALVVSGLAAAPAGASTPVLVPPSGGLLAGPSFNLYGSQFRWKTHVVRYHNRARELGPQVRAAARAWNRSGARIRWKAVPARRAQVTISVNPLGGSGGRAFLSNGRRGTIYLSPILRPKSGPRGQIVSVVAHEMGHIMGLEHETRRCANMNPSTPGRCGFPARAWLYRCRILELDDVRGAVRLFGGRPRPVGRATCPQGPRPPAVKGLVASATGDGSVELRWLNPPKRSNTEDIVALRGKNGGCPKRPGEKSVFGDDVISQSEDTMGGFTRALDSGAPLGKSCYGVFNFGQFGQPGGSAFVTFSNPGARPVADFSWSPGSDRDIYFEDNSSDADDDNGGGLVSWRWSFGDGTSSAERSPVHVYAAPGQYTVTLTVTDATGQAASSTQAVTAEQYQE